jgi:uncharacterized lipoprotein YajG
MHLSKSEFILKKILILVACTSLLAACGHKHPAPEAAAPAAQASDADAAASAPEITYSNASKPATYDPNLQPAPARVTLNLGSPNH